MRELINKKLYSLEIEQERLIELERELKLAREDRDASEKALIIMQTAAKRSQEYLAQHLSSIVTQAIQTVIEKPYEFVCEFVERRGSSEADLYLKKDDNIYDILESTGGGLGDVCSFALKVAYLLLSNTDNVLIIDEVSRHINSVRQRELFAQVLKKLSEEFEIQMIINTTIPELLEVADNIIELRQQNGETYQV